MSFDKALADARTAVNLAPELAEAHYALAVVLRSAFLDFSQAEKEFERALALSNLDPLRKEPRFQAIERELKFPN